MARHHKNGHAKSASSSENKLVRQHANKGLANGNGVGIMAKLDNSTLRADFMVAVASKAKQSRDPSRTLTRANHDVGTGFAADLARGLKHYREQQGLTINEACEKYGIADSTWRRVERGVFGNTAGQNIDRLASCLGDDYLTILAVGRKLLSAAKQKSA